MTAASLLPEGSAERVTRPFAGNLPRQLSRQASRRDGYPWALIVAFVAFSAWGNSLHAPASGVTLRLVAATPPLAAALSWHLLVLPSFGESTWRRWLARLVAAGVFGYTMWGSWSSLTILGGRAALPHPTVLPVAVDGLVFVAAVAVWSRTMVPIGTVVETETGPSVETKSGPGVDQPGDRDETGAEPETETEAEPGSETGSGPDLTLVDRRRRRDGRVYCSVHRRYEPKSTEYKHRPKREAAG